ncbi:hypothetical protein MRB53_038864 [Persea americana]|nr:hypothetical protein MRB53_038864 [Persea americana]
MRQNPLGASVQGDASLSNPIVQHEMSNDGSMRPAEMHHVIDVSELPPYHSPSQHHSASQPAAELYDGGRMSELSGSVRN